MKTALKKVAAVLLALTALRSYTGTLDDSIPDWQFIVAAITAWLAYETWMSIPKKERAL